MEFHFSRNLQLIENIGAGGRNRTDTGLEPRGILSPVRLPVSPLRHKNKYKKNDSICQIPNTNSNLKHSRDRKLTIFLYIC
jgi:hypothetical protein